jgi:hypothetical protein
MRVRARPGTARTWSASGWSRFVPTNWRVRWRLVAMVVVPAVTAAFLGGLTIDRDASGWLANGRVQNLAQLNLSVVRLSQALENERDLSAGYAANKTAISGLDTQLRLAQAATASAGQAVKAEAARIGTAGGYQAAIVQDVSGLLGDLTQLQGVSPGMFSPSPSALSSASKNVQLFAGQAIQAANTFSASAGNGTSDADLNGNATALGALLRVENQLSLQRGTLFVALSSSPPNLTPAALTTLLQAQQQQAADQAEFTASATQSELASFDRVIGSTAANPARTQEALAVTNAVSNLPLTTLNNVSATKLTAQGWYAAMTATVNGTHRVADQLAADVAGQAGHAPVAVHIESAGQQHSDGAPAELGGTGLDARGPVPHPPAPQAARGRARHRPPQVARDGAPAQRKRGRRQKRRDRADRGQRSRRDRRGRATLRPGAPRGGPGDG